MRHYDDLTPNERKQAEERAATTLLEAILGGGLRFSDKKNGDNLQARIDGAMEEAERMQTPWFAHEYIMERAGDEIRGMAQCDAEDALYPDSDERIIRL